MSPPQSTVPAPAPGAAQELGAEIVGRLRARAADAGLDALLITSPEGLAYAAGAVPPSLRTVRDRLAAALIPVSGESELVVVALEAPLMRDRTWLARVRAYVEFEQHPMDAVADALRAAGLADGRVGIERTALSLEAHERLAAALPRLRLSGADDLLAQLRVVKSPAEIAVLRDIGAAAERIAAEACGLVSAGATEQELAAIIGERYAAAGGDELTMLVVGSGERSAHPNAPATDRVLRAGDVVRLDVIGTKRNYCSDVARTAVVGEPTSEQRRVHDLLADVLARVVDGIRPGAETAALYAIYREAMERAGLPPYHFVGHGLGITLHEDPFVRAGSSVRLEEGMVLCIEPLTFVEGRFGMQLEDELIVTADGCAPITRADGLLRIEAGA